MGGKYDVDALKALGDLGFGLATALRGALRDGKIGLEDLIYLMPLLPKVGPAIAKLGEVPMEYTEIDEADAAELTAHFKALLASAPQGKVVKVAGKSLKLALALGELLTELKGDDIQAMMKKP